MARSLERIETDDAASHAAELRVLDVLLGDLLASSRTVAERVDAELAAVSADVDRVHELLEAQNYRLALLAVVCGTWATAGSSTSTT